MPYFSNASKNRLATCDQRLQDLFNEIIKHIDHTILEGHRGQHKQEAYFLKGVTTVHYPQSKHNKQPSRAVDAVPWPIRWPNKEKFPETYIKDLTRLYYFAGYVRGTADQMGIPIRQGADWDGDFELGDQNFDDLPHTELED